MKKNVNNEKILKNAKMQKKVKTNIFNFF